MKTRSFTIRLLLLTSILFSASCAAPTPLPTASQTPPATPTLTPTPAPTATPTEIPLPEGPISELQKTLGDKYKLTKDKEGDYFVINGIENLKFNQDGTAELAYEFQGKTEDLTIAFQAISAENEALQIGPWQNENGEWTMLTAGAPKTVEDAEKFPKLAYLEGHAKEKEIDRTNRLYDQWVMEKTATYDPLDEFRGIVVDGEEIEFADVIPSDWMITNYSEYLDFIPVGNEYSFYAIKIAHDQGWSKLVIYNASGDKVMDLINVPIVNLNPDLSVTITSALIHQSKLLPETIGLFTGDENDNF